MIRTVLGDRASASAITLLAALLLLIQGLLSGQAQGSMASAAMDPLQSICSMTGESVIDHVENTNDGTSHDQSHGKAADCPCCTLCRLAAHAMPAILGADSAILHVDAVGAATIVFTADAAITPTLRGLIGQPRAPPQIS
ncbi:DUF2946 domain-containing protein [Rhizobium sp. 2MFCol3.1]|uniref:DUF2946 family protein n=1 Tax=Rhizobium sp. 2MFCol3.1 TaxID=1246459 RepID=UPI00036A0A6B|nr:DUF2946 domain-containing protein [Rhizobium sp. 2MFCol3.1]